MSSTLAGFLSSVLLWMAATSVTAQVPGVDEVDTLLVNDGTGPDFLGAALALDGDTLILGAEQGDHGGINSGSACIFVRDGAGWTQQDRLVASDAEEFQCFGNAVDISGDTAVVADAHDTPAGQVSGSVYVFTRSGTTWTEQVRLQASDASSDTAFGTSVAIDGDTLAVGAEGYLDGPVQPGWVYVFERTGGIWAETVKLEGEDPGDFFGTTVDVEGDTLVVGATQGWFGAGKVYVYTKGSGGWTLQDTLEPADAIGSDYFGLEVSLSGETVAVGSAIAPGGAAYVFTRDGTDWSLQQKLVAANVVSGDGFFQVALDGDRLAVGATGDDGPGSYTGTAYLFSRNGTQWFEVVEFQPAGLAADDLFGRGVALQGDTLVVSSPYSDDPVDLAGSATVFSIRESWADLGGGTAGSNGSPTLQGAGFLVAGTGTSLSLTQAPPASLLLAWLSFTSNPTAFDGGTLYAWPPDRQFFFFADGNGGLELSLAWPPGLAAGVDTWIQLLVQDPSVPVGLTLSNAVSFTTP